MRLLATPVALTVVAVFVGACELASGTQVPAGTSSAVASPTPPAVATSVPSPTITEAPFESVAVAALHWQPLDGATAPGAGGLIGFRGGYVAYGTTEPFQNPVAFYSADGREWATVQLADLIPNCPGWGPDGDEDVPDAEVRAGTSDGNQVMLAGARFQPSNCSDSTVYQPMTWVSHDGRSWRRSEPLDPPGAFRMLAAWPTPTGWQGVDQGSILWESPDAIRWSRSLAGEPLVTTNLPSECAAGILNVAAPTATGGLWLVPGGETVCTSPDLRSWQSVKLSLPDYGAVRSVVRTRYGFLALGWIECAGGVENGCPPDERLYFLSSDGNTWERLNVSEWIDHVADGPSGILGIGAGAVWELAD